MSDTIRNVRDLANEEFDTRTLLRNAAQQAKERKYDEFFIADTDSHHYEQEAFKEIVEFIDNPILRHEAKVQGMSLGGVVSDNALYQGNGGRITRYPMRGKEKVPPTPHRDITLMERWMDSMGVDTAVMFPTPMLNLASCPRHEEVSGIALAYNRWLCEKILAENARMKSMLYLPFNDPDACFRMIEEFGDRKGVVGFMVTATTYKSNFDNAYMKSLFCAAGARVCRSASMPRSIGANRASHSPTASSRCTAWDFPGATCCT